MYDAILQTVATLVQFKRLANVYFLVTAVLQFIPAITPLSPLSAIAPLIFVLLISLVRTAVEEIGKYKYDRQANSTMFMVCDEPQKQGQISHLQWKYKRSDQLKVGNIVKIVNDERFPADILLLSTSNSDGKVYIETSSLDGEKNLKIRNALAATQQIYRDIDAISKVQQNKPFLTTQQPSQHLYSFNGSIEYLKALTQNGQSTANMKIQKSRRIGEEKVSEFLKINQFLYRDSVLRNTQYIIGVVVYAGRFTKSMMNSIEGRNKMSQIEKKVNVYMVFIFIGQFCLIVLCAFLRIFLFYRTEFGQLYTTIVLQQSVRNYLLEAVITACTYFILLNTMIPISLLVTIQIVKYGQGFFISQDAFISQKRIINNKQQIIKAKAWRSSINQQLGMVEYIFTDKTGTLTKNEMVLKKLIVGMKEYTNDNDSQNSSNQLKNEKSSCFFSQQLQKQSYSASAQQFNQKFIKKLNDIINELQQKQISQSMVSSSLHDSSTQVDQHTLNTLMLLIMSACHECIQSSTGQYHGSSPDQITLADSASRIGLRFIQNCYNKIKINIGANKATTNSNDYTQFTVEDIFEFNSDRKRMSIILSTPFIPNHKILLCKGADNIIERLLRKQYVQNLQSNKIKISQKSLKEQHYSFIKQTTNQYSKVGLRTLLFGYKFISNTQYKAIKQKINEQTEIENLRKQKDMQSKVGFNKKIELINKLQQNLWLCGASGVEDKLQDEVEQVIKDLIKANIKVCMLTGDKMQTAENIAKSCQLFKEDWKIYRIEEGSSEIDIFKGYCQCKDTLKNNEKYGLLIEGAAIATAVNSVYFAQMFQTCSAAVCCRITPKNKAEVVNFAKNQLGKLVLAIGDGANDVPMIQAANIGIGLYGNQGMNAVQASDFAIPQFKALWRLLFVHGRWNYIRIAELIKYFFYKNIVFTLGQLWYAYSCSFSGTSIYDATYLVLYNTIFTAGPVLVRALLQQDLNYVQIIKQVRLQTQSKSQQTKTNLNNNINTKSELNQELLQNTQIQAKQSQRIQKYRSLHAINQIPMVQLQKKYMSSIRNYKKQHEMRSKIQKQDELEEKQTKSTKQRQTKEVLKIKIDRNMKYLFPLLYTHSQEQLSLTPKIFVLLILQSMMESFSIFLTIYFGVNASQLWIFSICLYTSIFVLVTIRICYDIVYWTWLMVFALLFTSIIPYILFMYVMSAIYSPLNGTFIELFKLPQFYLCNGLAIGLATFIQGIFSVMNKYYFPTAVDFVRKQWKNMQNKQQQQHKQIKQERKKQRRKQIQAQYKQIMKSSHMTINTNTNQKESIIEEAKTYEKSGSNSSNNKKKAKYIQMKQIRRTTRNPNFKDNKQLESDKIEKNNIWQTLMLSRPELQQIKYK